MDSGMMSHFETGSRQIAEKSNLPVANRLAVRYGSEVDNNAELQKSESI